jgi:ABC-2 type transport system permease protein
MKTTPRALDEPITAELAGTLRLDRRPNITGLTTLFGLTLRQHLHGWRLVVLAVLFVLPAVVAVLARAANPRLVPEQLEAVLVFYIFPHALVPLAALLFASGMIQDEIEGQTLTYLLVRPLPRWAIYLVKLLASVAVAAGLAVVFIGVTYLAVFAGRGLPARVVQVPALVVLAVLAYGALFGLISLFTQRSLVAGIVYIILFEGVLANFNFEVRRLTVVYYFRVLVERWLGLRFREWSIDLAAAPSAVACVVTLVGASVVAAYLAARAFATREFRVKTPEGS